MNPDEQKCERSLTGRVIKLALPPKQVKKGTLFHYASEPIYVFNNSWFLRAPVTSTDAAANISHWNNAIAFCEEGVAGYDATLCNGNTDKVDLRTCADEYVRSDGFDRYPGESGAIPFFDCFRWLPFDEAGIELPNLNSHFDYDVSSNGFPVALKKMPGFETHGRHGDPGFRSARDRGFQIAGNGGGCAISVASSSWAATESWAAGPWIPPRPMPAPSLLREPCIPARRARSSSHRIELISEGAGRARCLAGLGRIGVDHRKGARPSGEDGCLEEDVIDVDVRPAARAAFAGSCRMRMRGRNGAGN